jgi:hypothetical protein
MLKFSPVSRDRQFYDQYKYGICVSLPEAGVLRAKTHTELVKAIDYRNQARLSWSQKEQIAGTVLQNLLLAFDAIDQVRGQIKLVVSYNIMYIYSNDVGVLQHLADLPYVNFCNAVQSVIDRPRDVILKINPKFGYRSYFRERMLEDHDRDNLLNFLNSRTDSFGFTATLRQHLTRNRYHWVQRHHFIEHNDPKDITMLSLVVPGLIRKTVPIQAK